MNYLYIYISILTYTSYVSVITHPLALGRPVQFCRWRPGRRKPPSERRPGTMELMIVLGFTQCYRPSPSHHHFYGCDKPNGGFMALGFPHLKLKIKILSFCISHGPRNAWYFNPPKIVSIEIEPQ